MPKIYIIGFLCLFFFALDAQNEELDKRKNDWVEAKLSNLGLEEKIGQLMMIRAHSDLGEDHIKQVKTLIEKYKVGSLCFFQGDPITQAQLTNDYQKLSDIPLLVAMDAEWGLGMRFPKSTISYPRELTLGALGDNQLIYDMGKRIAYELKRIGVHLSFSPVVDVNNNPLNPVINNRSFGEDPYNVTAKSYMYMKGLQDAGVIACAKHFPGHGDTDTDSHFDLPVIKHDMNRLDSIELYPFKALIDRGLKSVMVAHLSVPAIDDRENRPTTLSEPTVTQLLKGKMNFKGLIITDAMEMKGVTKHFDKGQAEAEAILAGNDIICLPLDVPKAISYIKKYIEEGKISKEQLDASVRKILEAKYDAGLFVLPQVMLNDLMEDINSPKGLALKAHLFEKAITLATDSTELIPFFQLTGKRYATVSFGSGGLTTFQNRVESYVPSRHFAFSDFMTPNQINNLLAELKNYDRVIVSTHDMSKYASKNFGISSTTKEAIRKINEQNELVLVVFGSPYALSYFDGYKTVVMSYTDDPIMQDKTAQALFGAEDIRGRLPVTSSFYFQYGQGEQRASLKRLGYAIPEEVGMSSDSLLEINKLVDNMIRTKSAPGCQILVAKDGKIVLNQAYGTIDYKADHKVKLEDIYDIASITKIAATTISIMKLDDQGRLDINGTMSPFMAEIDTSNKKDLTLKEMMAHHAGLLGWIPFYTETINVKSRKEKPLPKYYRPIRQDSFNILVASNLYMRDDYMDTIWHKIVVSDLRKNSDYKYSDLAFYFMMKVVEEVSDMTLDVYVQDEFYRPLGLVRTGFNPRNFVPLDNIVPSEVDDYYRNQTVRGYVHDMGAAMMGGVCGHAGLFTNSYELGIIMQMLINGGDYGGVSFMSPETVQKYTTRFSQSSRRGLGFDMREIDDKKYLNMSEKASNSTFGHLGFTGTCTFADPENGLVYVLLSNRTYPTMENNKFGRNNYRPRIQTAIYNSIMSE